MWHILNPTEVHDVNVSDLRAGVRIPVDPTDFVLGDSNSSSEVRNVFTLDFGWIKNIQSNIWFGPCFLAYLGIL
jgi:hypothetical protein